MSRTVLVADNRRAALTLVAARASEAVGGDLGAILVRDVGGDDLVLSTTTRWSGRNLAAPKLRAALAAGLLTNLELRPFLLQMESRQLGPAMVWPVGHAKHSTGALLIAKRASAVHFVESDLRLLAPFAAEARLAIAITEARHELERGLLARDRSRIARELHDGVIQSLYGIGMVLDSLVGGGQEKRIQGQLPGITSSINSIIDDLRSYIHDLTPDRLAKRGLSSELCSMAQEFQASSGVITSVRLEHGIDGIKAEVARDLVQISREALSNVAKHAVASRVTISLEPTAQGFLLEIADDGHGIELRSHTGGNGLDNIRRRARSWGGGAEIGASARGGTSIRVSVPRRSSKDPILSLSIAGLGAQLVSAFAFGAGAMSWAAA
jgi:signal transduction histidine kinase